MKMQKTNKTHKVVQSLREGGEEVKKTTYKQ